jgi:Mrp family chromosome partitioning ATPase
LHGEAFSKILQTLALYFDWILIDSPPIALTDTLTLARHAEGSLLVVRADRTPQEAVIAAVTALGAKHVLGLVLNGVQGLERRYSKYNGYYRKGSQR